MKKNDRPKTLIKHIIELRATILQSLLCILVCMVISLSLYDKIFVFLTRPITNVLTNSNAMMYTSVTEPITTELKISFYSALLMSVPFIMNRIWNFIRPALKKKETVLVKKYSVICVSLFIAGISFAYYIVIPNVVTALISIINSHPDIRFFPKVSENVSFVLIMLLAFGLSFQIPLIMIFLDKLKIISFKKQKKMWREYTVCIVIMSAIITPPDALSMIFLAVPLVFLYAATIAYSKLR